ncbi:beta-lactamase/transpeptidase-like protein [Zopfochytrium polystomum]|nr:beta-lactamase/transpeptidase-like protein [Zopfochytrium polystomum]
MLFDLFFRRLYVLQLGLQVYLSYRIARLWVGLVVGTGGSGSDDSVGAAADSNNNNSDKAAAARDDFWNSVNQRNAKKLYRAIVSLQGLWIKAGQYISTRADVVPDAFISEFRALQDAVPTKPLSATVATILADLNLSSLDDVFSDFDPTPLATASIAQVHRATLRATGEKVVVKVQHQNVAKKVAQDLKDLGLIIRLVGRFEPDYDFTAIIDEWGREVPKELDFRIEARNMQEIEAAIVAHNAAHPPGDFLHIDCAFPRVIDGMCTERVMVMTFVDGFKLSEMDKIKEANVNLQDVVLNIIKAYAFQIYVIGFWNSDPHPGNFLIGKSPTGETFVPYLLDFGLTKRATNGEVMALSRMLLSAKNMDFTNLVAAMQDLGLGFVANEDPEKSMKVIQFIFRRTSSKEETKKEAERMQKQFDDEAKAKKEKEAKESKESKEKKKESNARKATDAIPGVLIFFSRVISLLRGLSLTLDTPAEYLETMVPFASLFLDTNVRDARYGLLGPVAAAGAASAGAPTTTTTTTTATLSALEERVQTLLRTSIDLGHVLGAQVVVYHRGKLVVDTAAGVMGKFDPRPVKPDSLFPVFSCTKAITAAVALHLAHRKVLDLHRPVHEYWPMFTSQLDPSTQAYEWKRRITAYHLLTHTAGLAGAGSGVLGTDPFALTRWDEMVAQMERAEPTHAPGGGEPDADEDDDQPSPPGSGGSVRRSATSYHFLSFGWLVGAAAEKAAGRPFASMVAELLERCGVAGLGYVGIPAGVEARLAAVHWDASEFAELLGGGGGAGAVSAAAAQMQQRLRQAAAEGGVRVDLPGANASVPAAAAPTGVPGSVAVSVDAAAATTDAVAVDVALDVDDGDDPPLITLDGGGSAPPPADVTIGGGGGFTDAGSGAAGLTGLNPVLANPTFFNQLSVRKSVIPAASGNFSARGLAKFYQCLLDSSSSSADLFPADLLSQLHSSVETAAAAASSTYADEPPSAGQLGFHLGLQPYIFELPIDDPSTRPPRTYAFGHSGMGGSLGFAHGGSGTAVAVVVNQMSLLNPRVAKAVVAVVGEAIAELGRPVYDGRGDVAASPMGGGGGGGGGGLQTGTGSGSAA